jgi:hypothetical protein
MIVYVNTDAVMVELDKDLTLQWYEGLEEQVIDIMRLIPPVPESPDPAVVDAKSKGRDELNITDYAKLYAAKFKLPSQFSILLVSPPRYLNPFADWESLISGGKYQSLHWWTTHTELKHDWIPNLKKGCLKTALESLCALHQVISSVPDLAQMVLRRGWVPGRKPNPELVIEILEGKNESMPLLVGSMLFAVARGRETFPTKIDDFVQPHSMQVK